MKILFLGLKYNYPNSTGELGSCWMNVALPLRKFGEVIEYPLDEFNLGRKSKEDVHRELREIIDREKIEVLMVWLIPKLDEHFFRDLTSATNVVTVGIFGDDDGGFFDTWHRFARRRVFDWCVINYPRTLPYYRRWGNNVIGITGMFNPDFYPPRAGETQDINVSFVGFGGRHRKNLVEKLRKRGITVQCFGRGWQEGFLSHEQMINIFHRSKINLCMAGKPLDHWFDPRTLVGLVLKKVYTDNGRYRIALDVGNMIANIRAYPNILHPSIRGRLFELMASRSFILTNRVAYFGEPFIEGKEIVHYDSAKDLAEKIKYYVNHKEKREEIAEAAYKKFLASHTSRAVLHKVFAAIFGGNPKRQDNSVSIV